LSYICSFSWWSGNAIDESSHPINSIAFFLCYCLWPLWRWIN